MWTAWTTLSLLAAISFPGSPFTNHEEAETFLRTAEVVSIKEIGSGVTVSHKVVLTDGSTTVGAAWKTIDEFSAVNRFDGGRPEVGFRDSYVSEIAAYELDKLLGLDMVPPTVERKIRRSKGSLQLWLEGSISEGERRRQGLNPPDQESYIREIYNVRLFHQLIQDADYKNLSNILVDKDFRVFVIDSSRAFRTQGLLLETQYLGRFSRKLLSKLEELNEDLLAKHLGSRLSKPQRRYLLERRDLLLEYAKRQVTERGEDAVLFP